jgi:photoactive yellow protein
VPRANRAKQCADTCRLRRNVAVPPSSRSRASRPREESSCSTATGASLYNRAEEQLAGRDRRRVIGRDFFRDVAPCLAVERLGGYYLAKIGQAAIDVSLEFAFAVPFAEKPRDVRIRLFSIESGGQPFFRRRSANGSSTSSSAPMRPMRRARTTDWG